MSCSWIVGRAQRVWPGIGWWLRIGRVDPSGLVDASR